MNTGQRLVSLSGLPSGSALAHLMEITTGTGTGTGETIYASKLFVITGEQRHVFVQPTMRTAPSAPEPLSRARDVKNKPTKTAYVFTQVASGYVVSATDSVVITSFADRATTTSRPNEARFTQRPTRI